MSNLFGHAVKIEADTSAPDDMAPPECDVCGHASCVTAGFCNACRAADARGRQEPRAEKRRPRPTPRSTIEAIMWTVRERGPSALYEPANIERLGRCDDAAIAEIDARVRKLESNHHASAAS
jgi:hypothetical protein